MSVRLLFNGVVSRLSTQMWPSSLSKPMTALIVRSSRKERSQSSNRCTTSVCMYRCVYASMYVTTGDLNQALFKTGHSKGKESTQVGTMYTKVLHRRLYR